MKLRFLHCVKLIPKSSSFLSSVIPKPIHSTHSSVILSLLGNFNVSFDNSFKFTIDSFRRNIAEFDKSEFFNAKYNDNSVNLFKNLRDEQTSSILLLVRNTEL